MIVDIDSREGDEKKYIAAISSLIAVLVKEKQPEHLYVIRINKWFDHKWLKYSGKGRVKFEGSYLTDTALDSFWRDKLTFPPFNPKQIVDQLHWCRKSDGTYGGCDKKPKLIYKRQLRSSAKNLNNRVSEFTKSGLFVWFTSNTKPNMHGSILVYLIADEEATAWYSSFKQESNWVVDKTKGIEKKQVEQWFPF